MERLNATADESGQTSVEYALVLLLVAIVLVLSLVAVTGAFDSTVDAIVAFIP